MGLRIYVIKRCIYSFILIFFVISLNFLVFIMMPGNPIASFVSPELRPEQAEALYEQWGLNQPMHEQYIRYVKNMLTFQFGISFESRRPIAQEIGLYVGNTVLLMGVSLIISIIVGVILGVITASKRGSLTDSGLVTTSLVFYALPTFWMGMIFLTLFAAGFGWFPLRGSQPVAWTANPPEPFVITAPLEGQNLALNLTVNLEDLSSLVFGRIHHLFLPCFTLFLFYIGGWLLITRATMLECITEDYIVTARAKGLKERKVLYKHALKNASLPIITSAAISFGFLISGAILTETVYSWRGLGLWIWRSIIIRDLPALQAVFYLIGLCVIAANFIADLTYGVIDPRIKYG